MPEETALPAKPAVSRKGTPRWPLLIGGAFAALYVAWLLMRWGGPGPTQAFDNLSMLAASVVAASASLLTARRSTGRTRTAWALLGASCASWALGQGTWTFYELVLRQPAPYPSLADVGYFGMIPIAIAAMGAWPLPPTTRSARFRYGLDGLIVAGSLLFLAWGTLLAPAYVTSPEGLLPKSLAIGYVVGDLLIATMVFHVALRVPAGERRTPLLIGLGLGGITLSHAAYRYLIIEGAYFTGHLIDVGWTLGFLLVALGAIHRGPGEPTAPSSRTAEHRVQAWGPYVPFTASVAYAIVHVLRTGSLGGIPFFVGMAVVLLVVFRQILLLTENLELSRGLGQAYENLQRQESARVEMLNTIVHDLSNPITPIQLQLHLLRSRSERPRSGAPNPSLDIIGRNVDMIRRLVVDLRDLAQLEAGRLRVEKRAVDLVQILRTVHESFRPVAQAQGVLLERSLPGALEAEADPERVAQALTNLVNNALKFTPPGGRVLLEARVRQGEAIVAVRDSGRGLTPDEIGHLFQPFSRIQNDQEPKVKGTGLGLFITKGIAEQHGGRAWAESPGRGRGAAFFLALPLRGPSPRRPKNRGVPDAVDAKA